MMTTIRGIFDGKKLELLEPIELQRPHYVRIVIEDEVGTGTEEMEERREQILRCAGSWLDMPEDQWKEFEETF